MSKIAEYEDGTLAKKHKEVIGKMQDLDKYDQTTRGMTKAKLYIGLICSTERVSRSKF